MALELFYTSAPRGLKPQTSGFCTVAMTRGFPTPFVPRLEALSGYRPPHDGMSIEDSPTAWSHWIVDAGGVERHVLSAVGAARPDHTLRNNKFAHHLLLREDELSNTGPAWILAQPGVMARAWDGEPRLIDTERALPCATLPAAQRCSTWEGVCGDAGWAGVIANVVMIDPSKSCSIIYPAGAPVLELVSEALALLPTHWRWRVTFTTYFMQPMAGVRCAWRFCLDGTEAAVAARASSGTVVDLCARHPCTQSGTFIDRARHGEVERESGGGDSSGGGTRARATTHGVAVATPKRPPPLKEKQVEEPTVVFGVEYVTDREEEVRKVVRRVLVGASIVVALIACAAGLYWWSLRANSVGTPAQTPAQTQSQVPAVVAPTKPTIEGPALLPMKRDVEVAASADVEVAADPVPSARVEPPALRLSQPPSEPPTDAPPPTERIGVGQISPSAQQSTMPTRVSEWKMMEIPSPNKQNDESWNGRGTFSIGGADGQAQVISFGWVAAPERVVGEFEFPESGAFARKDASGVVQTLATITVDGSQAQFSWCAQGAVVRRHPKLHADAVAALEQVPLVAELADGTSLWFTWKKIPTTVVSDAAAVTTIAVASAPWQYSLNGNEWIGWDSASQTSRAVAVEVKARGGLVDVGTLTLVRKASKCHMTFQVNAANDPVALKEIVERAQARSQDAQATVTTALTDKSTGAAERLVNAKTEALATKESLVAARTAFVNAKANMRTLDQWEALIATTQGVPVRLTIRQLKFEELKGITP